jgi:hypothetical protein
VEDASQYGQASRLLLYTNVMTETDTEAEIQVRNTVTELLNTHADDVMPIFVVGETVKARLVHSRYSLQNG